MHDAHLLSMDAPSWGDTGGHTGSAPTNLHQPLLPRNLFHFSPSANCSPATFSRFSPSANCSPATFSCFSPSAEPLPTIIFDFVHRRSTSPGIAPSLARIAMQRAHSAINLMCKCVCHLMSGGHSSMEFIIGLVMNGL